MILNLHLGWGIIKLHLILKFDFINIKLILGSNVTGGAFMRYLSEASLNFFSDSGCISKYGSAVYTQLQVCAGNILNTKDTCAVNLHYYK